MEEMPQPWAGDGYTRGYVATSVNTTRQAGGIGERVTLYGQPRQPEK
jgi:hypothetical protein